MTTAQSAAQVSVTMPKLGESVVEGTVVRWLKREGDQIAKYEPLAEVMTDKVSSELPSPEAGRVARLSVQEGQTVRVGTEIAIVEIGATSGATTKGGTQGGPAGAPTSSPSPSLEASHAGSVAEAGETYKADEEGDDQGDDQGDESQPRYSEAEIRRRSSPLVRRLAKEHGIDLAQVPGTGTNGRVTKDDMLAYIERTAGVAEPGAAEAPAAIPQPAPAPVFAGTLPPAPSTPVQAGDDEEIVPASPMRRAIAAHMVRSVTTAPHAWTYVEVDVSGMVKARAASRQGFRQREGFDLTYVPFVARAVVETLREVPILNSTWRDEGGGQVVLKRRIHLGVAVALEDGLVVPVIRNADSLTVVGLARALNDLVNRARAGTLTVDHLQGGTFTLNNTGALGSILSMPIINQPQAGILTMEAITRRVVALEDDAIAVRPMMNLCLSFDHRVCDGLQVGRFMQSLKARLAAITPDQSLL